MSRPVPGPPPMFTRRDVRCLTLEHGRSSAMVVCFEGISLGVNETHLATKLHPLLHTGSSIRREHRVLGNPRPASLFGFSCFTFSGSRELNIAQRSTEKTVSLTLKLAPRSAGASRLSVATRPHRQGNQIPPKRKSVLPFYSWSLAQRGEA